MPPPTTSSRELQKNISGNNYNNNNNKKLLLPLNKGQRVSATLLLILCIITSAWILSSLKTSTGVLEINETKKQLDSSLKSSTDVVEINGTKKNIDSSLMKSSSGVVEINERKRKTDSSLESSTDLEEINESKKKIYSSLDNSSAVTGINERKKQIDSSLESSSIGVEINETKKETKTIKEEIKAPKKIEYPLHCSAGNETQTCSSSTPGSNDVTQSDVTCPEYFRWIHEDLKAFKSTGIDRDMVERAKPTANFRLIIKNGKVYVEKYKKSIQTRDVFTIWGIVQLLRRYPGKLPDLEMMFDCNDRPVIQKRMYRGRRGGGNKTAPALPPPLFRYCGDPWSLDIVFPDWSFWGWAEINIRPWEKIVRDMKKGNKKIKWIDREPYAYWKGNPSVAETRQDLLKCNVSEKDDWNARLFVQDWIQEGEQGFKQSNLADQCTHRYKIYIEGYAWSVSEKYILACDSPTLLVNTKYYDFFLRHLQPVQHYWPIRDDDKCKSIKFAVDWGNNHKQKAQEIGKSASKFMLEDLKMKFVYDYMFHLLNEYAKLLKFEVVIPEGASEVCSETMACQAYGREKKFMMESLVKSPSSTTPCVLPPPYDLKDLAGILRRKDNAMKQVRKWESDFWEAPINAKV